MTDEVQGAGEGSADFHGYQSDDNQYAGAHDMILAEFDYVRRRRPEGSPRPASAEEPPRNLVGLAISGGGIRSATFSLGVLQALARHRWLERIDYLSTVSGGGYIGSSLTWLTHQPGFGVSADNFPYGTQRPFRRDVDRGVREGAEQDKRRVLRWLRQHGKYLTPGAGITLASFIAVILRCILISVLVYFPLLVLTIGAMKWAGLFETLSDGWMWRFEGANFLVTAAAALAAGLVVCMILYSIATFFSRVRIAKVSGRSRSYVLRRWSEKWAGRLLFLLGALLVLGTLPFVTAWLEDLFGGAAVDFGLLSSIAGALAASELFRRPNGGEGVRKLLPTSLVAGLGFVLLVYGILLLAYLTASWLNADVTGESFLQSREFRRALVVAMVFLVVVVGVLTNLNYVSIHRYYRDRLMEAFMPNIPFPKADEPPATNADVAALHTMAPSNGPYHIINTNVVLVGSDIPKFRGRGGDNFILSPGYCGSNATGWQRTETFMDGNMMLPTAMAISGAAANPHTGVGGEGITRGFFASFLLAFLNIRLGYWAPNPRPDRRPKTMPGRKPNFLSPGLSELLFPEYLSEERRLVELTDGGHFENLALYELVRRKCKLIICCDGAADPKFAFGDLTNAIEKVRVDFGAKIKITSEELGSLVSGIEHDERGARIAYADRGFIEADIEYADDRPNEESKGKLIYIKATFPKDLPADLRGYKVAYPSFPNESTADQFFDEKQFEAYRELGFHLGEQAIEGRTPPTY